VQSKSIRSMGAK